MHITSVWGTWLNIALGVFITLHITKWLLIVGALGLGGFCVKSLNEVKLRLQLLQFSSQLLPPFFHRLLTQSDKQQDSKVNFSSKDEDPVLAKNRIRGSVPQTKGDLLNSIVSPGAPDPDPDPFWILTDPGWFSESRTSMERPTPKVWTQKRWLLKFSKIFIQ